MSSAAKDIVKRVYPDASTQALMAQLDKDEQVLAEAEEQVRACKREWERLEDRVNRLKKAIGVLN